MKFKRTCFVICCLIIVGYLNITSYELQKEARESQMEIEACIYSQLDYTVEFFKHYQQDIESEDAKKGIAKSLNYFDAYAHIAEIEGWKLLSKGLINFSDDENLSKLTVEDINYIVIFLDEIHQYSLDAKNNKHITVVTQQELYKKIEEFYIYLHGIYYE